MLRHLKHRLGRADPTTKRNLDWSDPLGTLRQKWGEVPTQSDRVQTRDLLQLDDENLMNVWSRESHGATTGAHFRARGWYHELYKPGFRGKRLMDFGSGMGFDGVAFAREGAAVTFVDIVETNLEVIQRVCRSLSLERVDFCYLETVDSLAGLPDDYAGILCSGSMHHAPFEFARLEAQALLEHLPVGGRWLQLAYPRERWVREGRMSAEEWGTRTDGWAPWVDWMDLDKVLALLAPVPFEVLLAFNFHNDDFNWFDLVRRDGSPG